MKTFIWVLFGLLIAGVIGGYVAIDYSALTPEQQTTAHLALISVLVTGGFWTVLELWTLLHPPKGDHISPVISKLLKTSSGFRIMFSCGVGLFVWLVLHFLGLF